MLKKNTARDSDLGDAGKPATVNPNEQDVGPLLCQNLLETRTHRTFFGSLAPYQRHSSS